MLIKYEIAKVTFNIFNSKVASLADIFFLILSMQKASTIWKKKKK